MQIAIISGSNRVGRQSHNVALYLEQKLKENTAVSQVVLLDVHAYDFPVMDERLGHLETPHPGLQEFSDYLHASQGLIIVTPEYNGSMAGSLKNTLDYFRKEFKRMPMAAVTVSSGNFGGVNALHSLWFWMLYNGGVVSPTKLLVSNVQKAMTDDDNPDRMRFEKNAMYLMNDLLWLVNKVHPAE